MNEGTFIHSSP